MRKTEKVRRVPPPLYLHGRFNAATLAETPAHGAEVSCKRCGWRMVVYDASDAKYADGRTWLVLRLRCPRDHAEGALQFLRAPTDGAPPVIRPAYVERILDGYVRAVCSCMVGPYQRLQFVSCSLEKHTDLEELPDRRFPELVVRVRLVPCGHHAEFRVAREEDLQPDFEDSSSAAS